MNRLQLTAHGAHRIELVGRYGPIAALRKPVQGSGPIALLVPGYTGSKEDFAALIDAIADAGIEPIAIDLPGQYGSVGPLVHDAYLPAALGSVVAEIAGKLAAEGRPLLLLGHSYGGLVARGAVLAGAPVRGLTLLSSGPGELPVGRRRQLLDLAEPILRNEGVAALVKLRELVDQQNPVWCAHPEELKEFYRQRLGLTSLESLLGMAVGLRSEPDIVEILGRKLETTGVPCLVACGADDDAWPVSAQRDMAERLDADFAVIPGARHSPGTENPQALLAILLATWRMWLAPPEEQQQSQHDQA
jgi:pimeloyl-ACP methyl ester carboxylesterase